MRSAFRGPAHQLAVRHNNYCPINRPAHHAPATARALRVCTLVPFIVKGSMVLSTYEKQKIVSYHHNKLLPSQILSALKVEGIFTTRQAIARFIARYEHSGSISHKEGSGRPSKITDRVLQLVETRMREEDEATATQLHTLLTSCGVSISLSTILRSRSMLGWTFRGSKYCQQIRHQSKDKRFLWVADNYSEFLDNSFENVIWSDEATVQLESQEGTLTER